MEYFKSSLKSVLGAPSAENQPSGAETVEKLVDRVLSSTLLDDRRDACRALKALSKTYRIEVGAQGMDALKQILEMDETDCEIIGLALDTLCHVTSPEVFEEEIEKHGPKHNIGEQFTEILIKNQDSVSAILKFLEEFDFRVRWSALKLLANLIHNKPKEIQEIILVSPMAISKLMDLLGDSREVIRNDALLVLIQLTKGNTNIQKIVAFENAFDRIFVVIFQEGGVEGGIVVEDCLLLMVNLLRGNYSNQNFFKEGSYIQKLSPMFQLSTNSHEDTTYIDWNPQKISNVHCMIQVLRSLVVPNGPAQSVSSCQRIMQTCGLLQALCNILMLSGVPADLLTETINAVAEVIRGNTDNQEFLSTVMAPSVPPRPAIVVLLMSMVNEKQPFHLRCAVLYCFQCFLYKNENQQLHLIQTLLPKGGENNSLTTGQLLCGGLFSPDPLSNWFAAVALSYALLDGVKQREQLLRVLLASNIGTPPITLMQQCVMLLHQGNKIKAKIGLLILLCRWTSYSALAVANFLSIDSSISYLIALLSSNENNEDSQEIILQSMCAFLIGICIHFNDDSVTNYSKVELCDLVVNRIGLEKFMDTIASITKHEAYSRSLKHPQPSAKNSSEILLDHEFCRLIKILEGDIIKTIMSCSNAHPDKEDLICPTPVDSTLIVQYKDLIRKQDSEIQRLNIVVNDLLREKQEYEIQKSEMSKKIDSLVDQIKVLRAAQISYPAVNSHIDDGQSQKFEEYKRKIQDLETRLTESLAITEKLKNDNAEKIGYIKVEQTEYEDLKKLKSDQEDLLELLAYQDQNLKKYKEMIISLGGKVEDENSEEPVEDS